MTVSISDLRVAVEYMALSVRRGNERVFMVMLSSYSIEGTPYRTAMFTVSPGHVTDLRSTEEGFACGAKFPEDALTPGDRKRAELLTEGVYRVRLTVDRADITAIMVQSAPGSSEMASLYAG